MLGWQIFKQATTRDIKVSNRLDYGLGDNKGVLVESGTVGLDVVRNQCNCWNEENPGRGLCWTAGLCCWALGGTLGGSLSLGRPRQDWTKQSNKQKRVLLLAAQREMQHMASVKSPLFKKNTCLYDQHLYLVLITHILSVHFDCRVIQKSNFFRYVP